MSATATVEQPTLPEVAAPIVITKPGVYDIPSDVYHTDPVAGGSLSVSWAKKLLTPSCPAKFRYERDHGQPEKREFDLGHAAHREVLGVGEDLVIIDADSYRTKAAQQERDDAYRAGKTPLLLKEYESTVRPMADKLRQHPLASALLSPERGKPEQSLFWRDQRTGVICRGRLDHLPHRVDGRMIAADYKTAASSNPDDFDRVIHDRKYHMQADWYLNGLRALGLAGDDAVFVFIVQEKTPPFVVTVIQPDHTAMAIGRILNRQALGTYQQCITTGIWPGYTNDVAIVGVPAWVERQYTEQELFS